jgi:hypothetical protein
MNRQMICLAVPMLACLAGCGAPVKRISTLGPELENRILYDSAHALICARDAAAARDMAAYLREQVPRLEREYNLSVRKGVILALSDLREPVLGTAIYDQDAMKTLEGLVHRKPPALDLTAPPFQDCAWVCVLPTDRCLNRAADDAVSQFFPAVEYLKPWNWPVIILLYSWWLPYNHQFMLVEERIDRDYLLARAALPGSADESRHADLLGTAEKHYSEQLNGHIERKGRWLMR